MKTIRSLALVVSIVFATSILFSSFTNKPAPTNSRVNQIIADWQRAKAYTQEYLDAMPEDGMSFKPAPEVRTFAEQMLHLSQGSINIVSMATGKARPYDGKQLEKMDEFKTKEAVNKIMNESYDYVIGILQGMNDDQLNEKVKFFNNQEYTREVGIAKAFEHQTHHRGQTTIYLRTKGVTPPNEKLF